MVATTCMCKYNDLMQYSLFNSGNSSALVVTTISISFSHAGTYILTTGLVPALERSSSPAVVSRL